MPEQRTRAWQLSVRVVVVVGALWQLTGYRGAVAGALVLFLLAADSVFARLAPLRTRIDAVRARIAAGVVVRDNVLLRLRMVAQAFLLHEDDVRRLRRARELLALRKRTPAIQADKVFDGLVRELEVLETRLAEWRAAHVELTQEYNEARDALPLRWFVNLLGFSRRESLSDGA